ncbi:MAG TPA: hypothetical protein DHW82_06825 [Spirochaetia bacterium]|nr:MAG: hypothetical protein A2Y41_00800 [Spirochaetes bacterium GWB1_36_13]HCL56708.1 hypothetical protein [Spirochaetia bacterium]
MEKDFHYYLIRILAEKSGFSAEEAQVIAYASQYVDDATESKTIKIDHIPDKILKKYRNPKTEKNKFDPVCTAHNGLQHFSGFKKSIQYKVYIPFHFLPDLDSKTQSMVVRRDPFFTRKLIFKTLKNLKEKRNEKNLIRLGILFHVYADSWSHENFSGRHSIFENNVSSIHFLKGKKWESVSYWEQVKLNLLPAIGHAEAGVYPDKSFLVWKVGKNFTRNKASRNNSLLFLEAAERIYQILFHFLDKKGEEWCDFEKRILKSFQNEVFDIDEKCLVFEKEFPEIHFHYDKEEWRRQALQEENSFDRYDWENLKRKDYKKLLYSFKGDFKWFLFHLEALKHRNFILKKIKRFKND